MKNMRCYNKILLIDDNEIDNLVNEQLVKLSNFAKEIDVVTSAREALDYLKGKDSNAELLPELIFLDIIMPEMDGFEFLNDFDKLNDTIKNKCKIVMLSSSESFKDLNRANSNKYVYKFLNKPLTQPVLAAINV